MSARATTWLLVGVSGALAGGAYLAERVGVASNAVVLTWLGAFLLYGLVTQGAWRKAWDRSRAEEIECEPQAAAQPAPAPPKTSPALPVTD